MALDFMKKWLNRIYVSHASQAGQLMLACTLNDVKLDILMEYEQGVIVRFLLNEGSDTRQIAEGLRAKFHEDAYPLRTVQFWIMEVRLGREDLHDEPRMGRPSAEDLTAKIQELLDQNPFESARAMAETLQVSHSTVLKHLHEDFHFQSFHFCSVSHPLREGLREQRRGYASEMIPILASVDQDGSHHLVTEDESQ
jgi:transposase